MTCRKGHYPQQLGWTVSAIIVSNTMALCLTPRDELSLIDLIMKKHDPEQRWSDQC